MTTLTYQPDQGQPEFSEEELNSIQVGEQLEQEQQQLLAGKYESAEQLEQAYLELQQKFGSNQTDEAATEEPAQESEEQEAELDLMEALWQQSQSEYDEETLESLRNADPADIAQAYLDYRAENQAHELTSDETSSLYDVVGGEEQYTNMLRWAADNCDEQTIEMYDAVMSKGDLESCFFAVQAMAFRMAEMEGWQPDDFLSGRASVQTADVFRSQAEVVEAMSDPRYDRDPAYRQDIMNKLERSTDLMY
tara:strand:+ start:13285 stop:14034 length:750 start_codon:yes stop_codon:yes gene_type:complete